MAWQLVCTALEKNFVKVQKYSKPRTISQHQVHSMYPEVNEWFIPSRVPWQYMCSTRACGADSNCFRAIFHLACTLPDSLESNKSGHHSGPTTRHPNYIYQYLYTLTQLSYNKPFHHAARHRALHGAHNNYKRECGSVNYCFHQTIQWYLIWKIMTENTGHETEKSNFTFQAKNIIFICVYLLQKSSQHCVSNKT